MALKVIWTPIALEQLESIVSYLEGSWPDQVVMNFAERLEQRVEMISNHPEICKRSDRYYGARDCLITKHNTLFYIIRNEYILSLIHI